MHALHRPHLPSVITVTLVAAVMAVALTLAVAARLDDHAPTSVSSTSGPSAAQASAQDHASSSAVFTSPFSRLLTKPVIVPWVPPPTR